VQPERSSRLNDSLKHVWFGAALRGGPSFCSHGPAGPSPGVATPRPDTQHRPVARHVAGDEHAPAAISDPVGLEAMSNAGVDMDSLVVHYLDEVFASSR
jgi:hypothetical protein